MKNILLAISGLTPQIITETLFALAVKKKITIDEIYVITTQRGKKVIEGKDKDPRTPKVSLASQILALSKDYNISPPKFKISKNVIVAEEESIELYDVKTDKDNMLFPNKTAILLKKLTSDPSTVIHASLSGGRKSMSAHLALTLSLFARQNDKLYHVLTDEKFESANFYPKNKAEKNALVISEIPFVKLRSLNLPLINNFKDYSHIVQKTQKSLNFLTDDAKLIIDLKERKLIYKSSSIHLTPVQIGFYALFAERAIQNNSGFSVSEVINKEFAHKLAALLTDYYNYYIDPKDTKHWIKTGYSRENFLSLKSKLNKTLSTFFNDSHLYEQFSLSSKRKWGDSVYSIKAPKNKISIRYD